MDDLMFSADCDGLGCDDLAGFFVGWPHPPTLDDRLEIVRAADEVVICRVDAEVVGFATAITDRRFAAYIPLVEVLPAHQGRGIGSQMVTALLERLRDCYMIDLVCDDDVVPFYERLGGTRLAAVAWRNHHRLDRPVPVMPSPG
jgi:GNAT superfamily N-acetyltransferase